jgi:hypothetical protein
MDGQPGVDADLQRAAGIGGGHGLRAGGEQVAALRWPSSAAARG